ncbi:fatty acyl-CoA reductase 1 [Teleopsis dalmanni]|uniref:fatty acyl-CoA reductase 1 n=1 Tax=Teleopsis dalmanni TaxID=139649 RepID=UPI0018CF6922|nr:fatty acyl-CoA reductase 1 [Teleopsis dalmanni]
MIAEFFKDSEIFITGGTGVVGKALIEKLLRSCDVKRIYVLLRPKKGLDLNQRLEKLRNANVFNVLKTTNPDAFDKLYAIPGDVTLPCLGITEDHKKLMENVSVVYHSAATIRFDEPMEVALNLNVGGTLQTLKFAESLKDLKLFMHISTFFSNPHLKFIEPKVYPAPIDWKICLEALNNKDILKNLNFFSDKLSGGFPNTYTFTKNLSESLVNDYRDRLPVAIFKPSVVLFSVEEPEPGFSPSLIGAMGVFALVAAGILKTVYINRSIPLDITLQDIGIKVLLYNTVAASRIYEKGVPTETPTYLSSSCTHTPFTFTEMCEAMDDNKVWDIASLERSFLIPGVCYTQSRLLYKFLVFTKEVIPCMLGDVLISVFGHKPALMSSLRKVYHAIEIMKPFLFNGYTSSGITDFETICKATKGTEFDVNCYKTCAYDYPNLVESITKMGYKIRENLMHQNPKTLPKARKILRIKKRIYRIIQMFMAYYMLNWFYSTIYNFISINFSNYSHSLELQKLIK